jgi:hypothetical protein
MVFRNAGVTVDMERPILVCRNCRYISEWHTEQALEPTYSFLDFAADAAARLLGVFAKATNPESIEMKSSIVANTPRRNVKMPPRREDLLFPPMMESGLVLRTGNFT